MLGEFYVLQFWAKKQLNLYLRVLYYVTTKPKIVLEQFTIRKTHANTQVLYSVAEGPILQQCYATIENPIYI